MSMWNSATNAYYPPNPGLEVKLDLVRQYMVAREEDWIEKLVKKHFPGIYSLVQSYQPRLALHIMKAHNIHTARFPNGAIELRQGSRILGRLEPLELISSYDIKPPPFL